MIKKGFTLFELLIVVIIIAVVYFLLVPKFNKNSHESYEFKDIKKFLKSFPMDKKTMLLCIKDCKECYIYSNEKKIATDFIKGELKAYSFNGRNFEDKEFFEPKYIDSNERICFKYELFPSGVSSESFVEYNGRGYYFPPYFEEAKEFENMYEAQSYYEQTLRDLKD